MPVFGADAGQLEAGVLESFVELAKAELGEGIAPAQT
jgi:hypothetical protein